MQIREEHESPKKHGPNRQKQRPALFAGRFNDPLPLARRRFGTVVRELPSMKRGRWNRKTTSTEANPVQKPKKAYILPTFFVSWPIAWGCITNGERVVMPHDNQCPQKTTDFEVQKFQSHRPILRTTGLRLPAEMRCGHF